MSTAGQFVRRPCWLETPGTATGRATAAQPGKSESDTRRFAGQNSAHPLLQPPKNAPMICVSVTPTSRTLAKVDLLNAAGLADVVELCVDFLVKTPEFADLYQSIAKPVIVSCRRRQDGGQWDGTEPDRLALLRQAIVAGPAYVELDEDAARAIPRFGKTQRVVSFSRRDRGEFDIDQVLEQAQSLAPDIVKLSWPTPTLDDAWPLLAAITQKRLLPIVGHGTGRTDLTLALLGRKHSSPWVYAALEKGMEVHPGQPTIHELDELFQFREIDAQTRFVAVGGFNPTAMAHVRVMNAGFKAIGKNMRCLPLAVGRLARLKKMLELLKVPAFIPDSSPGASDTRELVEQSSPLEIPGSAPDFLVQRADGWHGYNVLQRALKGALAPLVEKTARRSVLVIGTGGVADTWLRLLAGTTGPVSVSSPENDAAEALAKATGARHVPFAKIYETLFDVLILADPTLAPGTSRNQLNPSIFRHGTLVIDVARPPEESLLTDEARDHRAHVVAPREIYVPCVRQQFQVLTGVELPESVVAATLSGLTR